nr:Ig-like domain-containing protein [Saccharofermentans sp.]
MKKRLFTRLTCMTIMAAILLSFSGFVYADGNEDEEIHLENVSGEPAVADVDQDNDYLAEQYIMSKMPLKNRRINVKYDYENKLKDYDLTAYYLLLPYISEIASGKRTSTVIELPEDKFSVPITCADAGVESFAGYSDAEIVNLINNALPVHRDLINETLINAFPYELYWYDRELGMAMLWSVIGDASKLTVSKFKFVFYVSSEYRDNESYTKVNDKFGKALSSAATNVQNIINDYADCNDYDKLLGYNNTICEMTEYNHAAADNENTPYGNPWQLVWIFDGDPDTTVVCEGYAKGFQYLCDNSTFRSDEVYTIPVKGMLSYGNTSGGHEWNIVHMDDGKNYLVDPTNCDGQKINGNYTRLFMVGAQSGSVEDGYYVKFSNSSTVVNYTYFPSFIDYYGSAPLTLESTSYDPNRIYSVKVLYGGEGTAMLDQSTVHAGDIIHIRTWASEGYEVDKILVNGKPINLDWFYMPGRNTTVEVSFKKIDYKVNVNYGTGGKATAPSTANYKDLVTVDITPDTGYELDKITVNEREITGNTFTMPLSDATVNVTFKKINYNVQIIAPLNGEVTVSAATANYGDNITVTAIPEIGYEVDQIKVNGDVINGNTFTMPAKPVTVAVTFKQKLYNISVFYTDGGTAWTDKTTAHYSESISLLWSLNEGYELDYIKLNGKSQQIHGDGALDHAYIVLGDTNFEVGFKKIKRNVTVMVPTGGDVNVSATTAYYGEEITITATPNTGYAVDKIYVNLVPIKGNTFTIYDQDAVVNVTFKKVDYTINVSSSTGGKIEADATAANYNDKITVTAIPETGYELDKITLNGTVISGNTFDMPASNVTIKATFKKINYKISVNADDNGSATVPAATANYGDKITVTVTPRKGYEIDSLKVNGAAIVGTTFDMPAEPVTVEVTFKKAVYKITLKVSEGAEAGLTKTEGYYGDEITVDVNVKSGYHLVAIKVNGEKIDGNTFTLPDKNTSVEVVIEKDTYNVKVASATNGKVTVSKTSCASGTEVKVTVTADKNYVLDKLTYTPEGGKAVDITSSKKFTMPAKNVTVNATFKSSLNPSLKLDKTSVNVVCGNKLTLKATLKDSNAKISWKSSDTKTATVDSNGKVTAKQAGKVTITASAAGLSAKCTVQVLFKDVTDSKQFWYEPTYYLVNKGI